MFVLEVLLFVCCFAGEIPCEVDWALQHHMEYAFQNMNSGDWKPLQPLPEKAPDSHCVPPPPEMLLLTVNAHDKSLKFPEKVLAKWHDHSEFSGAFREKYRDCKANYPLDLPNARQSSGEAPKKRPRTGADESAAATEVKVEESALKDVADLKPLHHKAHIVSSPKLNIEVCVGQAVYIANHTNEVHVVKEGAMIGGYWKGKFWSTQPAKGKDGAEASVAAPTVADIPFELSGSTSRVQMNSKVVPLGSLIKTKREISPADALVAYHVMRDQPTADDASAFVLSPKAFTVYWKMEDLKPKTTKTEGGGDDLIIPAAHIAGTIPHTKWSSSKYCEVLWAVKWPSVAAKGLQPVRPLVAMCLCLCLTSVAVVESCIF